VRNTLPAQPAPWYWATATLVNVVVFVVIAEWAVTMRNPWIFLWNAFLVIAGCAAWRYRAHRYAAALVMATPILVLLATGLAGRWAVALFTG
jgi:hypothetical protein